MNLQNSYSNIECALTNNRIDEALSLIAFSLQDYAEDAHLHYLKGKAHVKLSKWHEALSCFTTSERIDGNSAATASKQMIESIFNFYNKDMYNP